MQQLTNTSQTLEMNGPRGLVWRPVPPEIFQEARELTAAGRTYEALLCAQDAYIATHGDMHGVGFRVVTREVTVTVLGALDLDSRALYTAAQNNSGA
jgi:hypothetical protein